MKIVPKNTPAREGGRPLAPAPAASPGPGPKDATALAGVDRAAAPDLSPAELARRAGDVAAAVAELGVPELSPAEAQDLVLVIDPRARPIADTLRFALPQAPGVARRSGQSAAALGERNAQIGALIGVRRIGERGERACRVLRGARVRAEQQILDRLLAEIRAELGRASGAAKEKLAADAGERLELVGRREQRRKAQLGKGRAQVAAGEERVKGLARETRALRTIVALQGGEAVADDDAREALGYLEEVGAPPADSRRAPR